MTDSSIGVLPPVKEKNLCQCGCGYPAASQYKADGSTQDRIGRYAVGHAPPDRRRSGGSSTRKGPRSTQKRQQIAWTSAAAAWLGRPLGPMERVRPLSAVNGQPTGGFVIFQIEPHDTRQVREGAIVVTDPRLPIAASSTVTLRRIILTKEPR